MALTKILKHASRTGLAIECQILHIAFDGTVTQLDHADGIFRSVAATPKIPLVEVGTTGLFTRDESRSAWADGNHVMIANVVGMTTPDGAVEFVMQDDAEVALDSIMSRLGTPAGTSVSADVAALPTVAQISAAVVALGGIGGIITGVVDAGVTVSSSFNPISMEKGEKKVLSYRITQGKTALGVDIPFDLSAYTGKFAVKADLYDSIAKIGPIDGAITAHADDTGTIKSVITFTIPTVTTKAMATFNGGRYSVAIYDIAGSKAVLTPTGGVEFNLMEDILDVA